MNITVREALSQGTAILHSSGTESARLDAEVLLAHVLGISRTLLYIKDDLQITADKLTEYFSLVQRRKDREPVAYITGEKEFMSLSFIVNDSVLIPRPETEILVEEALAIKPLNVIDVGTGSGAIAISLAFYLPDAFVRAVDISPRALQVARENAAKLGVDNRVEFYQGSLLEPFDSPEFHRSFDLITANLPYIPTSELGVLQADVRDFEPKLALDGGEDGLDYYRDLCPMAKRILKKKGVILLEFGYAQDVLLVELLKQHGFSDIRVLKDLAGLNRVIIAFNG